MNIEVIDRITPSQYYHVANVPFGLGFFASVASSVGDSQTQLFEKIYHWPDSSQQPSYSKTGFLMYAKLASDVQAIAVHDPIFAQDLDHFMDQCVFYDILLGKYTLNDLMQTEDIWGFIGSHSPSMARAFQYTDPYHHGSSIKIVTLITRVSLR